MVETKRHGDAFDYYYSLGAERSFSAVVVHCKCSARAVANWSKEFNWQERIIQRDLEINKKTEDKTDKAIVNTKADYRASIGKDLKSLDLFKQRAERLIADFSELVEDGKVKITSIDEFDKVTATLKKFYDIKKDAVKLDLELMGEAADGGHIIIINDLSGAGDADKTD